MKFLLLSNVNMQPLATSLKPSEVACGAYNSLLADLATAGSPASAPDVSHVLCMVDSDTMLNGTLHGDGAAEQCGTFVDALDGFCARNPAKTVVAHTFCLSAQR